MHDMKTATVVPDRLTDQWRDGIVRGEFLVQRCKECGAVQFYPREHCVAGAHTDLEWIASSGRGVLYTYTVVRYSPNEEFHEELPFVLGIVDLEEGVRITTRIVTPDFDGLTCGMPVSVRFGADRESLPFFVPLDSEDTHS